MEEAYFFLCIYLIFKLRKGASIIRFVGRLVGRSVGRLVGWSVCWSVRGKNQKSKNQNVLIIFDYLIDFGASLRTRC